MVRYITMSIEMIWKQRRRIQCKQLYRHHCKQMQSTLKQYDKKEMEQKTSKNTTKMHNQENYTK